MDRKPDSMPWFLLLAVASYKLGQGVESDVLPIWIATALCSLIFAIGLEFVKEPDE
jgi:hypothetical protein